jgi:hypothetical protein
MGDASAHLRERVSLRARELGSHKCPKERAELAKVAGRTARTIRNWKRNPRGGRRGRPPHSLEEQDRARRLVLAELRVQGFTASGRAVVQGLEGRNVPTRLIRAWVRDIKAAIERDARAYRQERTLRMEVLHPGEVAAIDATYVTRAPVIESVSPETAVAKSPLKTNCETHAERHEGIEMPSSRGEIRTSRGRSGIGSPSKGACRAARRRRGRAIQALIAVDVATTLKLGFKVVHAPKGNDVIDLLVAIKAAHGAFPLVLMSDNGSENVNAEVAAFLARHRIVPLRNVPRTPRHNASVERSHRELKAEAELDRSTLDPAIPLFERVRISVGQAMERLNNRRLRESRAWKTAAVLETARDPSYAAVDRDVFYAVASAAAHAARGVGGSAREQRLAERWAVLRVMEAFGLVKLFRGGVPITGLEAERVT